MALTKVQTNAIADDAVTTDKLANAINTERTANTAKVSLGADSVTGAKIADDAIDSEHITDGSVDIAHLANGTDGQIITWNASGVATAVGPGTDGQVLTSTGAGSPPAFETLPVTSAEGTAVLSTGESGGTKFLREDGDGSCSWQTVSTDPTTTSGTNNFTVADGNLVIGTAGHGVDFSAVGTGSSVTADENLLDDYEAGTWTPSVVTGTIGSGTEGYYVKVGNVVHVNGRLETWSDTTSGGPIIMNVRPFAASRAVQVPMACHLLHFSTGSGLNMSFHFHNNNNWYVIYGQTSGGQSYFQHSDIQSSSCSITFSGSYIIA